MDRPQGVALTCLLILTLAPFYVPRDALGVFLAWWSAGTLAVVGAAAHAEQAGGVNVRTKKTRS